MIDVISRILKYKDSEAKCYVNESTSITYKELISLSLKYSKLLNREGTSPVIIYGHKSIDMIVSIISCIMANRCYVPVDVFTPINRLKKIILDTKSTLIINNSDIEIENSYRLKELEKFSNNSEEKNNNDLCYIIFTSGSTGDAKGVLITRNNLNNFVNYMLKFNSKYKGKNVLNTASFSFDLSVADIFFSLCSGGCLYSIDNFDNLIYMYQFIKNNNINYIVSTPTFSKLLLLDKSFNSKNFPSIECFYFCGETFDRSIYLKLSERFPYIDIINAYGPSEACSAISMIKIDKDYNDLFPVGKIDDLAVDVKIINNEIFLSGKSVFKGYLNSNSSNGVYYTGDLGYFKDGLLYCVGRKDNQIKYKGYRIELSDIEINLKKCNGIKDAIVVAKKDNGTVKCIKAFVIADNFDYDLVIKELKENIPFYMIPKTIKVLDNFPITNNNKIDRKVLEND